MSEISGIIRNSIERGWSIAEVRASLLNAGYNPQEIEAELSAYSKPQQQMPTQVNPQPVLQPIQLPTPVPATPEKYNPQSLSNYQTPEVKPKASNTLLIIIIVLLVLCVAAGAGLFLLG